MTEMNKVPKVTRWEAVEFGPGPHDLLGTISHRDSAEPSWAEHRCSTLSLTKVTTGAVLFLLCPQDCQKLQALMSPDGKDLAFISCYGLFGPIVSRPQAASAEETSAVGNGSAELM